MKKYIVLTLLVTALSSTIPVMGQALDLTPTAGYFLGGKVSFYQGDLKYNNAASFGVALDYDVTWKAFEFYYSNTPTTAQWRPYLGFENTFPSKQYDVNIHYFQVGGMGFANIANDRIDPFGAFTLGATWFQSKDETVESYTQFSVTLGGGLRIWATDRVGIRLQGRLLLPMYWGGIGVGCGIGTGGGGCGTGVSASTNHIQGDFTGGVILRLMDSN